MILNSIIISKTQIDLSKQQELDADPKAIRQINFTGNPDLGEQAALFLIDEETKETVLDFSQGTVTVTVCSCHVTYAFQSKSTLYSFLNVKELLARSRRKI